MLKLIHLLMLTTALAACSRVENAPLISAHKGTSGEIKIIENNDGSFGYEIWLNGKRKIIQPTIPAIHGHRGFLSELSARKTAELMVNKIESGEMPPSITLEELTQLGALDQ
ncbi:DUF4907 domain-containing protein [Fulvivirga ulvae]|uniref:DUF4907 domain-containing protein n=1 Tax=Fulvivirga ulvae TaxID=2904245 RepID=UPI001F3BA9A1|nr:DUF4907 domain-containing protein [Fulvivirga ulvae]UII32144.1 DUF4907 domain-containing protein [Fulvivirga ulvae]